MCYKRVVPCDVDHNGVLIPNASGIIDAIITTNVEETDGSVSGRVMWGGRVYGFITFDSTGTMVIGFTPTDLSENAHITEKSIRNILLEI